MSVPVNAARASHHTWRSPSVWTDRITPEIRLAALCGMVPEPSGLLAESLLFPVDWSEFLRVVERHRLTGLAYRALAPHRDSVPAEALDQLRRRSLDIAKTNLKLLAEALRLTGLFRAAGIEVAFLKGLPLGVRLHGDLGTRHCGDLDLLVTRDAAPAARRLLLAADYRQELPSPQVEEAQMEIWYDVDKDIGFRHADSGILVELHWRLVNNDALMPPPPPGSWVDVLIGRGAALPALSVSDEIDYLILHGARHAWSRLKWLADVGTILARMPGAELSAMLERATAAGARRPVLQAVVLCSLLFGLALPEPAAAELARSPILRRLVHFALTEITHDRGRRLRELNRWYGPGLQSLYHYFLQGSWRYRWSELRRDLINPADWSVIRLPAALRGFYWLLRLPLWLRRKIFRGK